ncbi:E2 ubiquitin-conjugating enzyme [Lanmaoa asiatica]|nr:E2 ubiquitin-conjugating enzyme [Lanmaoa asiatica]
MLKILSMKKNEGCGSEEEAKDQRRTDTRTERSVQTSPMYLSDLTELDLPTTMKTHFPDPADLLNFTLTITPDEGLETCTLSSSDVYHPVNAGMYRGGAFIFSFTINNNYPHEPPKVKCTQTIYHPNVDLEGNVCLNILREDWKPVLNLNSVMVGLQYLFLEPNADDPLNKEAAEELRKNRDLFIQNVKSSMRGVHIKGVQYARVLVQ